MKIALGADHRGTDTIAGLAAHLKTQGHEVSEAASCPGESCDYPENAWTVGQAVSRGVADRGILICGSGIGMSIAANKIPGIRAALVSDEVMAGRSRRHNNANVLCLSADLIPIEQIIKITEVWLETEFEGGRHARRVDKITAIEQGIDPATTAVESTSS